MQEMIDINMRKSYRNSFRYGIVDFKWVKVRNVEAFTNRKKKFVENRWIFMENVEL